MSESKWILVSERLPKKAGRYICTVIGVEERYVDIVCYDGHCFYAPVLAWMQLPRPMLH